MAFTEAQRRDFETLLHAAKTDQLCLVESFDTDTGKPVAVIACVSFDEHDMVDMFPFATLIPPDGFARLRPPEGAVDMTDANTRAAMNALADNAGRWPLDMEQLS